jgi:hypothetical protein
VGKVNVDILNTLDNLYIGQLMKSINTALTEVTFTLPGSLDGYVLQDYGLSFYTPSEDGGCILCYTKSKYLLYRFLRWRQHRYYIKVVTLFAANVAFISELNSFLACP